MKAFVRENNWLPRTTHLDFGWGNGYVLIPEGHPLHGCHYDYMADISVHGGITFSELVTEDLQIDWDLNTEDIGTWCVGFDTLHYGDNLTRWSKEMVEAQTEFLKNQILSYQK